MRRLLIVLLSGLLLSACGYGNALPPTATMSPFGNGKDTKVGDLLIQDITVVTNLDTTFSGLSLSVINNTLDEDTLIGAVIGDVELEFLSDEAVVSTLLVKPRSTLRLGHASSLKALGQPELTIGSFINIGLVFQKAGIVETRAMVVTNTGMYSDVSLPAPLVTPSIKPEDHGADH
jgi:hypothetical protein